MTDYNDGGPAFPQPERAGMVGASKHFGMSLLDWFAGQVVPTFSGNSSDCVVARWAYDRAEALLAEKRRRMEHLEEIVRAREVEERAMDGEQS